MYDTRTARAGTPRGANGAVEWETGARRVHNFVIGSLFRELNND
jgi:hypothetical protein